jgi:hypothetical protein
MQLLSSLAVFMYRRCSTLPFAQQHTAVCSRGAPAEIACRYAQRRMAAFDAALALHCLELPGAQHTFVAPAPTDAELLGCC